MLEVPTVQSVEKTFSVIRKSYITAFALLHFQYNLTREQYMQYML